MSVGNVCLWPGSLLCHLSSHLPTVADVVVTCGHLHDIVSQNKQCPESLSYLYSTLLLRLLSHAVHTATAYGNTPALRTFIETLVRPASLKWNEIAKLVTWFYSCLRACS